MTTPRADVTAYVLAGGASRRFGRDKARAEVDGTTLLARNGAILRERYGDVRVVSAPDRSYADLGLPTITDIHPGRGPLAGIHAALVDSPTELIAIAACDLAGLRAEWYATLEAACDGTAAAFRDERWHPVVGIYHRAILPELERRLEAGELAVWALLDAVGTAVKPPAGFGELRSIDTPDALYGARGSVPAQNEAGTEPRPPAGEPMTETRSVTIRRHDGAEISDLVAVEEPLEVRLGDGRAVAITMRTPGHDDDLAVGFLFGERLLQEPGDLDRVVVGGSNVVEVHLAAHVTPELRRVERNFYTTSSCGVCGKGSLEALGLADYAPLRSARFIDAATIHGLGARVRAAQAVFDATGGLHAAALFSPTGELLCLREDVGRHNAVDKLVGWAVRERRVPLDDHLLYLSGRASFELLQKALAAGIPFVCAVGAPSSLAVEVADEFGITLCGFVRDGRFNVYSHPNRIAS